jgi:hypothetical protein
MIADDDDRRGGLDCIALVKALLAENVSLAVYRNMLVQSTRRRLHRMPGAGLTILMILVSTTHSQPCVECSSRSSIPSTRQSAMLTSVTFVAGSITSP